MNAEYERFPHGISAAQIRGWIGTDRPTIVEVGCNDGTDTQMFLDEFPEAEVYCFEPDPRPLRRFRAVLCERVHLIEAAVSDVDGDTVLYQSGGKPPTGQWPDDVAKDWDLSSSICRPTGHLAYSPWCTFEKSRTVKTIRLDTWLEGCPQIDQIDFLWADVQGAEHLLIAGAAEAIARTRFFYTEFCNPALHGLPELYASQRNLKQIAYMLPHHAILATYGGDNVLFGRMR